MNLSYRFNIPYAFFLRFFCFFLTSKTNSFRLNSGVRFRSNEHCRTLLSLCKQNRCSLTRKKREEKRGTFEKKNVVCMARSLPGSSRRPPRHCPRATLRVLLDSIIAGSGASTRYTVHRNRNFLQPRRPYFLIVIDVVVRRVPTPLPIHLAHRHPGHSIVSSSPHDRPATIPLSVRYCGRVLLPFASSATARQSCCPATTTTTGAERHGEAAN